MLAEHKDRYERLIDYFEAQGCKVYNAHRRESWGREYLTPEECSQLDFDEISASDLFLAFPGYPASPGTHVEIGWATALAKPTVLLLEQDRDYAFLVTGLPAWSRTVLLRYDPAEELIDRLEGVIAAVMSKPGRSGAGTTWLDDERADERPGA